MAAAAGLALFLPIVRLIELIGRAKVATVKADIALGDAVRAARASRENAREIAEHEATKHLDADALDDELHDLRAQTAIAGKSNK